MGRKNGPQHAAKELELEERRAKAVQLKRDGLTYRAIGERLGVSLETAYNDVMVVLERTRRLANETAQESRQLSLERLELLVEKLTPLLDDEKQAPRAAEVLKGIEERRSKLLGLDAPAKHEHAGPDGAPIAVDGIGSLIDRLASRIAGEVATGKPSEDPSGTEPRRD